MHINTVICLFTIKTTKIKEQIAGENMFYDFGSDGTYKTGSKSIPENGGNYQRSGDLLISTDASGKADTMRILSLTANGLDLRSDREKMTIMLEKM